jgi:type VI secretion system protein ImpE
MNAKDLLRDAKVTEALTQLQNEIRADPSKAELRVFLFQLCCVTGALERAVNQLQVAAGLDPDSEMLARIFKSVIECELFRRRVFEGTATPLVFGEPEPWVGMMIQALAMHTQGDLAGASQLRTLALQSARPNPGKINGEPVAWLSDADSRLGPIVEAMVFGKYYWIPFHRIRKITLEAPADLRDLVWIPVTFEWSNGGQLAGHIPVRYPGTETSADGALQLARKTEFTEPLAGTYIGHGQRMWVSESADHPLLEARSIEFDC